LKFADLKFIRHRFRTPPGVCSRAALACSHARHCSLEAPTSSKQLVHSNRRQRRCGGRSSDKLYSKNGTISYNQQITFNINPTVDLIFTFNPPRPLLSQPKMDAQRELFCHDCQQIAPQGRDLTCSSCGSQFVEFASSRPRQTAHEGSQPVHLEFANGTWATYPEGPPPAIAMAIANLVQGMVGTPRQPTTLPPDPGRFAPDAHAPPPGYQAMPGWMPGFARPRWDPVPYPQPPRTGTRNAPATSQNAQDPSQRAAPYEPGVVRVTTADDLAG
jgi:hypothetical protein